MKKFVCLVCGYVYEGESAPEECPICHAPASKFAEQSAEKTWAAEHVVGIAKGADQRIIDGLRENFNGECTEVGMYLAMARVAHREGYPEIGLYWEKAAFEEAEHAAKFAELLGEVVPTAPRKTLKCVPTPKTAPQWANLSLQSLQRSLILTPFTTPYTKWQRTKQDTAERLKDCSSVISISNKAA